MDILNKIDKYLVNEAKWNNYEYVETTLNVQDSEDNVAEVPVKIYYEYDRDNKQNNDLWVVIDKDFTFMNKKYKKGAEFPTNLEKYVNTGSVKKFNDYTFKVVQD